MKVLIIDNNIDQPWGLCGDFRRYLDGESLVRRAPQGDLPSEISAFSHVILSGSKTCILDSSPWVIELMGFVRRVIDRGVPLLGVCYGHQIIARALGGDECVRISPTPEIGWVEIRQTAPNPVLEGLPERFYTFQSHYEEVCRTPKGFVSTANTGRCANQAYFVDGKPVFGVQFHPERNSEEGQLSIERQRIRLTPEGAIPAKDCIFGDGRGKSVYSESVARTIFGNFMKTRGRP